jgi:hypothetical protein
MLRNVHERWIVGEVDDDARNERCQKFAKSRSLKRSVEYDSGWYDYGES